MKQTIPAAAHFDLIDFRLFANIAETNSLTRGADLSHISPPAASTRIKNIEAKLGARLLYRTSQGVALAPAGEAFLHHGLQVLRQLEQLWGDLQEYANGLKGHVRILANTTAITEFLPKVLRTYLVGHPDVNVDLRERSSHDVVHAIGEGIADIGIAAGNVNTKGLNVLPYRRDRLVLATARSHPLAKCKDITFEETLDFDFISLVETSAIHGFLNQVASDLNRPLKIRIQVGNFEALCRMIETNIGIGVLPESASRRYVKNMSIQIIQLNDTWATRNLQIYVRDLDSLPVFSKELVDLLISDAARESA